MAIVPASFLVRCRFPVPRIDRLPRSGQRLLNLKAQPRIAMPSELDGRPPFAELWTAWNPQGLGFELSVSGRTMPVLSNPEDPTRPDGLQLWIDTRDTQSVHRATRYCHHFCVLPVGGGKDGGAALTVQLPVARARDDSPLSDSNAFLTRCRVRQNGYDLEVWIPTECLHGFEPHLQPRLGFSCCVNDAEHGPQPFGVGPEFPVAEDPSLWHTLELQDA